MVICEQKYCTGCEACVNICKRNCIIMAENEQGFLYPSIDTTRCSSCGLCAKVCPVNTPVERSPHKHVYASLSTEDAQRAASTSGGIFPLLAEAVLSEGGYVYGVILDDTFTVRHAEAHTLSEIAPMRGAKYVQSSVGSCYQLTESRLKSGSKVLFTGTPCQIAGLRNFLKKDYPNLLTADILCHGVPSPGLFRKYVKHEESVAHAPMKHIRFRTKEIGWKSSVCVRTFQNGVEHHEGDSFVPGFLDCLSLRESCFSCPYASDVRCGDITLGDFWGYKESAPEYIEDDDKGISLVLINTPKGEAAYKKIQKYVAYAKRTIDDAKKCNEVLSHPESKPKIAEQFWQDSLSMDWSDLSAKYISPQCPKDPLTSEVREYYNIPYRKRHRQHILRIYKKKLLKKLHLR